MDRAPGTPRVRWAAASMRAQERDAPFERLFAAEYGRVVAVAYRVLADAHEAEDVAQEAFTPSIRVIRPLRRSDMVLGKWLGLATLLTVFAGASCGIEFVISKVALSYEPPHPVLVIVFLVAESLTVLTLALAASTRLPAMTGGIIVVVLFWLTWMGGIAGAVGSAFHMRAIEDIGTVSSLILPIDGLWRAAIYNLEPVALLVAGSATGRESSGNPFFVVSGPPAPYLLWAFAWVAGVLGLAIWSFSRREL